MSDITQDIKDTLDIAEVIRSYITVLPAGRNFKANCPFHKEKTPSFMISPERRSWHCFGGCNEGGDVIAFVMKYENIEFYDALKLLAERAGIDSARLRANASEYKKYDVLYQINAVAKDFFKANLAGESRAYCAERGLAPETIADFEVGYAPQGSDVLLRELTKRGFAVQDIKQAGLVFLTERGTYWDRFRNRLMFPLYNHIGKVVGFTGRVMPNDPNAATMGKYVNSPETPIFNKSKILYGFHKAKSHIRDSNTVLMVEGQMDCLMAYQAGVQNTVACSGTALTADHLTTIRRLADKLLLCFDSDEAGQRAIDRGIDMALAQDFSVGIVHMREKDPADIVRQNPALLAELIGAARPARAFYFARYIEPVLALGEKADVFKKGVRAMLMKIKTLKSPLEQSAWLQELAGKIGMSEHTLQREMDLISIISAPIAFPAALAQQQVATQRLGRKELIIQRIAQLGGAPELKEFASEYQSIEQTDMAILQTAFHSDAIKPVDRAFELEQLIQQLKIEWRKERLAAVKSVIRDAQAQGDEARLSAALKEFDNFGRELHTRENGTATEKSGTTPQSNAFPNNASSRLQSPPEKKGADYI